jgi:hypothetical protein
MGERPDKIGAHASGFSRQDAFHEAHCLPALHLGFRGQQVPETFDLGQIQSAIQKGPAGEFSGIRRTEVRRRTQNLQDPPENRRTAMQLEFYDIFSGEAGWSGKEDDNRLIELLATGRVAQPACRCVTRI